MALSQSYDYAKTRDTIITRALRIIGAISQGETPSATAVTEASETLNDILKEWQADGLQLYHTTVAGLSTAVTGWSTTIAESPPVADVDQLAPLKIHQMWYRYVGGTTEEQTDTPIILITEQEYQNLSPKHVQGVPTQCFYRTPRVQDGAANALAAFFFFPALSQDFIDNYEIQYVATYPIMDFTASGDNPDLPNYLWNALVWALADQLSYEYGVGLAERSMITKKAQTHKAVALSFDQEEGSLLIRPDYKAWDM